MRKKLLAGVMALALCSTNMLPQTIFAGEFTSGNSEEVSEVFTDTNQESAEEELSVFASESVPEFSSETNIAPATTDGTESIIDIDLTNPTNSEYYNSEMSRWEIFDNGSYRFKGSDGINSPTNASIYIHTRNEINIYLNNVNIVADLVPALEIQSVDNVNIYLENNNFLKTKNPKQDIPTLMIGPFSFPTINNSQNNSGSLTVYSEQYPAINTKRRLTINGGSVTASSTSGTGIESDSLTIKGGSVDASSISGTGIKNGSLTIKGGSVDASSISGTGIENDSLTINGGSVKAFSTSGTGIKSNSLTIEDGSVKASSTLGTGIESGSLTIKGGSVTASSANETEKGISSNQITINGGSVKASSVSSSPKNTHGEDVYCCTIENPKSEAVIIDRNPTSWEPKNHQAVDPLYAWLTGETHTISVGNTTQTYYFDKKNNNKEFKPITNQDFTFTKPSNLTYDGTAQKAPLECKIEDIKDKITLSYYNKDDGQKSNEAINAGTYTVMANIAGNSFTDPDWTFTIKPRNLTILIDNKKRKYGEDNPKLTYLVSEQTSLAPNDTTDDLGITLTTDATKSSPITDANTSWLITMASYTNKNYNIQATSGTLTINPATFDKNSIKISAYNGTYDECEHPVINENSSYPDGSTVEYSTETGSSNWNTTCPKVKNVSDSKKTKVWIRISKDNYEPWFSGEIQATISPAKIANLPLDPQILVPWTCKKVADITTNLPTNQNDFGFHLGRSGAFDFPAVLSVKADASCAGLMANLFWYDVENGVLQCIQTVTVGGAFERSIPYADFTLSKGQDYFIAFGTESLNGRVIHTDGSITDENGAYLRPANTKISSHSIDRNKLTVKLSKGCAGAQGYDFVISKKSNMLQTGKFSKTVSSTGKPQASFRYLAKGTWYVAARSWVLDAQGNKVYGSWTKIKKIKITVVTPQQPKIKDITVKENTVTVTYTKCKNATGYEILLGNKYKTSAGEKYPVKKYVKRTEGKNTVTVTFTNVKKGTWYVTVRSWNKTSKNKSRVYSPYSDIKKFKVKK